MEFGIFANGYTPGPAAHDSESEHFELLREAEFGILAEVILQPLHDADPTLMRHQCRCIGKMARATFLNIEIVFHIRFAVLGVNEDSIEAVNTPIEA